MHPPDRCPLTANDHPKNRRYGEAVVEVLAISNGGYEACRSPSLMDRSDTDLWRVSIGSARIRVYSTIPLLLRRCIPDRRALWDHELCSPVRQILARHAMITSLGTEPLSGTFHTLQ